MAQQENHDGLLEALLEDDLERVVSDKIEGLSRSLSHYLGAGATAHYPAYCQLELGSVPTWQSFAEGEKLIVSVGIPRPAPSLAAGDMDNGTPWRPSSSSRAHSRDPRRGPGLCGRVGQ
jgi:hypothetical protein